MKRSGIVREGVYGDHGDAAIVGVEGSSMCSRGGWFSSTIDSRLSRTAYP
jgi:hypothetical protein